MTENGNGRYTAQQFIDAIPGTGGIITKIAGKVGCAWHTAKKYIYAHPTVLQAYNDEKERLLDTAESNIWIAVEAFDIKTSKWVLMMKGQDRGFVQNRRMEVTGKDRGPIEYRDAGVHGQERDRALASLADAIADSLRTEGGAGESALGTAEQSPMASTVEPG